MAADQPRCTLVTGPANSGKSRWAESLAMQSGQAVCYVATGPQLPDDPSWQVRLRRHRERRPSCWQTLEVGLALADTIRAAKPGDVQLIDSLGTWVAAGLDHTPDAWGAHTAALLNAISTANARLILVGEETGWGVSPPTQVGGLFRDRLGALLQQVMGVSDAAWLVLHGRAIDLMTHSIGVPDSPA